jgi:hypothetical protein
MTRCSYANRSRYRAGIRIGTIACAAAVALSAAMPLAAHHSFSAEFDGTREIKVTGEVSNVEWMNPHGWIHLTVQEVCERPGRVNRGSGSGSDSGSGSNSDSDSEEKPWACRAPGADEAVEWGFELASPNGLMRQGWTRHSLTRGDHVTIEGFRARDDSAHGNARVVTTADGKRLFAGSSQRTTP